jgi:hypothetical protein
MLIKYQVGEIGDITFRIYDVYGKQIRQIIPNVVKTGVQDVAFKRKGLAEGVYFISLILNDKILSSKKIIIQ